MTNGTWSLITKTGKWWVKTGCRNYTNQILTFQTVNFVYYLTFWLLKFTDNTTLICLIQDGDEAAYRQEVKELAAWCILNNLVQNMLKKVEMSEDFRRNPPALPTLTITNRSVTAVESFRFLDTTISQHLKWDNHIESIVKKAQQMLYFLRQLRKFNLPQELLKQFLLCHHWIRPLHIHNSATKSDLRRLRREVRTAERIISTTLPNLQELYLSRVRKRLEKTLWTPHIQHTPSLNCYRLVDTTELWVPKQSYSGTVSFPKAIHLMNTWH